MVKKDLMSPLLEKEYFQFLREVREKIQIETWAV